MNGLRRCLAAAASFVVFGACAGIPVGRLATRPVPSYTRADIWASPVLPPIAALSIHPSADTTICSRAPWSRTPLDEEHVLLAGTDEDARWVAFVEFDLTSIPHGAPIGSATLHLPLGAGTDLGATTVDVELRRAFDVRSPDAFTWTRSPALAWVPFATARVREGDAEVAVAAEHVVADAVGEGAASLLIAVVVRGRAGSPAILKMPSTESYGTAGESLSVVTLDVALSAAPAPESAAEADLRTRATR